MNILWIEDDIQNKELFFDKSEFFKDKHHRVEILQATPDQKIDFDQAYKRIKEAYYKFDLVVLDINLNGYDIGEEGSRLRDRYFTERDSEAFLKEAGFHLYLQLIQQGFKNERLIFLTTYTKDSKVLKEQRRFNSAYYKDNQNLLDDSLRKIENFIVSLGDEISTLKKIAESAPFDLQKINRYLNELAIKESKSRREGQSLVYTDFEKRFHNARLPLAPSIYKNDLDPKDFHLWLDERLNPEREPYFEYDFDYLTLRRGVIEACDYWIKQLGQYDEKKLADFLLFYKTTNIQPVAENERQYVLDYLRMLKRLFPLNPPENKPQLYQLFLKELVKDWEISYPNKFSDGSSLELRFKRNCQFQMKQLRNWTAHHKISTTLQEWDVAYLFIIAMRAWFNMSLDDNDIQDYEKILSSLFEESGNLSDSKIKQLLAKSYSKLMGEIKVKPQNRGDFVPKMRFLDLISTFNWTSDKDKELVQKQSMSLFYQSFWHGLYPITIELKPIPSQGETFNVEIKFGYQSIAKIPFLNFFGKLIYSESN